jgi:hypothetical protein
MLLDDGKPRVSPAELRRALEKSGFEVRERNPDIGVVVGGDGRFSRYGRTEDVPLLFVGVRSNKPTGSKAYLAEVVFDEIEGPLDLIRHGRFTVREHRRLRVLRNKRVLGEVFTDAYLERGAEGACLRYNVRVSGAGLDLDEVAIGDGVVVCTSAGSTGYFSYPDRLKGGLMEPGAYTRIPEDKVGICHVTPTYTERRGTMEHPLRYTIPWGSRVDLWLFRRADARLYGVTDGRAGVRVSLGDRVTILPGTGVTRVISILGGAG